ncbi:MAG: hypothetical protein II563_04035 [Treponema sp.]|nr:hypothetical protein [Treponema sp.]MBQ2552003.1 hypothetical protein [Treponema sp.]MBQ4235866.1 hypothetical protein [Treponema sp.]MBQ5383627.1 hypothetical protein [Treponema sp.]
MSIESFFDAEDKIESDVNPEDIGLTVLSAHQEDLVQNLRAKLKVTAPDRLEILDRRLKDLKKLATAIANFPSLLQRTNLNTTVRTPAALVDNIISYQEDGDTLLHMPSKATLGKGFLVTKIHTFFSMSKLAKRFAEMDDKEVKKYYDETVSMMFTLMAEDVYMNLIKDKSLSMDLRQELANALIILWEHRSDQTISDIAPVLQAVWNARRTLAPAFGTMMGTSELLLVSIQMDAQWTQFIKKRLGDQEVSQAMEEFLFGLSYEQILRLRAILREQGVKAIGRDEVSSYLGERVKTDVSMDYRDFYLLYTVRRDNARARQRLHLPGPTKTLEDFFIRFVMEQNAEKQKNDSVSVSGSSETHQQ